MTKLELREFAIDYFGGAEKLESMRKNLDVKHDFPGRSMWLIVSGLGWYGLVFGARPVIADGSKGKQSYTLKDDVWIPVKSTQNSWDISDYSYAILETIERDDGTNYFTKTISERQQLYDCFVDTMGTDMVSWCLNLLEKNND